MNLTAGIRGWFARRRCIRGCTHIPPDRIRYIRDHAASLGLAASVAHYDAILSSQLYRRLTSEAPGYLSWLPDTVFVLILAAWLAAVTATWARWQPAVTGRLAAALALVLLGCGFWANWAEARTADAEPDDEDAA